MGFDLYTESNTMPGFRYYKHKSPHWHNLTNVDSTYAKPHLEIFKFQSLTFAIEIIQTFKPLSVIT